MYSREDLGVQFWKSNVFQSMDDLGPGPFISLTDILSHAVRMTANVREQPYQVTMRLNQRL